MPHPKVLINQPDDDCRPAVQSRRAGLPLGRLFQPSCGLNLLEPGLVKPHTAVIIPFDDRVIFVSLLNCAEFPGRLSEVAQTLDAISGIQCLTGGKGFGERWLLGTVESGVAPGYERGGWDALASLGIRYGNMVSLCPRGFSSALHCTSVARIWIKHRLGKSGSAGPNCTVSPISLAQCAFAWASTGRDEHDAAIRTRSANAWFAWRCLGVFWVVAVNFIQNDPEQIQVKF